MPNNDGTGPLSSQGPMTGGKQGPCIDDELIIKDVIQKSIPQQTGPGGHIPNGTGHHGKGMGPGKGCGCQ